MSYMEMTIKKDNMPLILLSILIFISTNTRIQNSFGVLLIMCVYLLFWISTTKLKSYRLFNDVNRLLLLLLCLVIYFFALLLKDLMNLYIDHAFVLVYIFLFLSAAKYVINVYPKDVIRKFVLFNMALLCVSYISGLSVLDIYPYASRDLAGAQSEEMILFYKSIGAAGYGFIYGNAFLSIGCLYAFFKSRKIMAKVFLMICYVLSSILILRASYSMAMFVWFIFLVCSILFRKKIEKWYFVIVVIIIGIIMFSFRIEIVESLIAFGEFVGADAFCMHMNQILRSLSNGGWESELARIPIWEKALSNFISNPIFGSIENIGHSFVLKHLALFGLLSTPIFAYMIMTFRELKQYMERWIYTLVSLGYFGILLFNSYGSMVDEQALIFCLLPCTLFAWREDSYENSLDY